MIYLLTILAFLFGSVVGSFLNVLILRLPAEETMGGRSHCMSCKHKLGAFDLVPIFSFLFLRGKCRYCRAVISKRYIAIEALTGGLFALVYAITLPSNAADFFFYFRSLFIISVLIVVFVVDLEHFLILDRLILPSTIVLLFFNFGADILSEGTLARSWTVQGVLAAAALGLFFYAMHKLSRGTWLGFGDVKFALFLGLATPGWLIIVNVFLAYAIGAVMGIFLILARKKTLTTRIPFGTLLAISCIITLVKGPQILYWYLRLIGLRF